MNDRSTNAVFNLAVDHVSRAAQPGSATVTSRRNQVFYSVTLLLIIVGALLVYKGTAALAVIDKVQTAGAFQARPDVVPIPGDPTQVNVAVRSINYFAIIWPALLFGILISAAVRVLDPPRWLGRVLGYGPIRSYLVGGLTGVPLMLCSCCVAPVFSGVYERSSRLGPSVALMLAAPSLNPAALILTFMLFDQRIALMRLAVASVAVFFTGILVEQIFSVRRIGFQEQSEAPKGPVLTTFLRECVRMTLRTVPLIVVGVFLSMALALWLPLGALSSQGGQVLAIVTVALIATPLAMPTFFEIPLALIMLSAGAPAGAAVAMLIAGPAINLPSLFTIARSTNRRVAAAVALAIFTLAVAGGLLVSLV
jgi:uncharacterized membrane protein YraQ (UPF0718 family)